MKIIYDLGFKANRFVSRYKNGDSLENSAAKSAVGSVLVEDSMFGIRNPINGKKRLGILASLIFLVISIPLILAPILGPSFLGVKNLNSQTTATITAVEYIQEDIGGENSASNRDCNITAVYNVSGQRILSQALYPNNEYCSLGVSQQVPINYDSVNPTSWAYNAKDYSLVYKIALYIGIGLFIISLTKIMARILSAIYGLSLKRKGKSLSKLIIPNDNLSSKTYELKNNFIKEIFGINTIGGQTTPSLSTEEQINQATNRVISKERSVNMTTNNQANIQTNSLPNQQNINLNQDVTKPQAPAPNENLSSKPVQPFQDIDLDL